MVVLKICPRIVKARNVSKRFLGLGNQSSELVDNSALFWHLLQSMFLHLKSACADQLVEGIGLNLMAG